MFGIRPRIHAKVDGLKRVVNSLSHEGIDLHKSDLSLSSIGRKVVNGFNTRVGLQVHLGIRTRPSIPIKLDS